MRECGEYEITVAKLLRVVHSWTECIKIYVVTQGFGDGHINDKVKHDYYLTENFSKDKQEEERVLKYYADVPVWNIHVELDNFYDNSQKGRKIVASIVANCCYADVRAGRLREKADLRKAKQREYSQKRKREG